MSQLNYMLDDALPFVITTMDSKQANKFKTCQGNVFIKLFWVRVHFGWGFTLRKSARFINRG